MNTLKEFLFIIIKILPEVILKKAFKITDIPLVPPSNKEFGKINSTVPKA